MAAKFAQVPQVRAYLKQAQQHLGNNYSFVAEGRDMGTEVFPSAPFKFFLDARPEVRAQRRYDQLIAMGKPANLHELTQQIAERDHQDRTRAIAPLIPASDAHIVDTSHLTIHQVFSAIITTVTQRQ